MLANGILVAMLFVMRLHSLRGCTDLPQLPSCTCCSSRLDDWNKNYCLNIRCPKSHVLVQLNVTSGNAMTTCLQNNTSGCFALSSGLKADTNLCYWETACSVRFPQDPLVVSTDIADPFKCAGDRSKFLRVFSAQCARQKETIDMQKYKKKKNESKKSESKKSVKLNGWEQGIIRSHALYPWDYSDTKSLFTDGITEYKTIFKWPKKFSKTKKLLLGVHVRGICDTEELELVSRDIVGPVNETHNACTWEYLKQRKRRNSKQRKRKNTNLSKLQDSEDMCNSIQYFKKSKLEISFRRNNSQTYNINKVCEGFLLCFKVVDKSVNISGHVCDLVADKTPCITERGAFTDQCEQSRDREDCCCPSVSDDDCTKTYKEMEERRKEKDKTKT